MSLIAITVLALARQDAKPMPLIHATALASVGGRIYAGTNSGEVHVYDARTREPITAMASERKGVVSSLAASPYGVAWVIGNRPTSIRDKYASTDDIATQALIYRAPDDRTYTIDLKPAGVTKPVRSIAWLGHRLWLLTDFGVTFYNSQSNAIELGNQILPKFLADDVNRSRVWVRDPYVLTAKPVSIRRNPLSTGLPYVSLFTVYKLDGNRWSNAGGFASNAFDVEPEQGLSVGEDGKIPAEATFRVVSETVDFDTTGVAAIEGANVLDAPLFTENWATGRHPLPGWFGEPVRPDPLWVQVQGDNLWMWNGSALVRLSRTKSDSTAYLPWNDPQMLPNAFLADGTGLWVGSNVGVRRIEFGAPEKPTGYGGFVSVPLGPAAERTEDPVADKVVKELYKWRFAPVAIAGTDGSKMVSAVYKAAGITLPNSTPGILNSPTGMVVYDELKIGDVVSSSRGLAIYIGNGKTVEVRDGVVKNGTVWDRPFAVVRRFSK